MRQFNSKVFYVITEGARPGRQHPPPPITGNYTVMDALGLGGRALADVEHQGVDRPPVPGGS